jgi:NAD(P)H-nitrite reductase large subunit
LKIAGIILYVDPLPIPVSANSAVKPTRKRSSECCREAVRTTPLPLDRTGLLVAPRTGSGVVEDEDTVCTCNAVTAGELRRSGCHSVAEAARRTRATTGYGSCASAVAALLPRREERTVA